MKLKLSVISKAGRVLVLVLGCALGLAHADDYTDISQLLKSGKFAEAMGKIDSQLAAKPGDAQLRFFKGVTQRNLGKTSDAIATFTKLTQDFPDLPEPYNNLAVLYAGQGQYDKARQALEMAIRTNPSYATAHENIGDIYARLASQAYNKALQLDDNNTAVPPKLALIREIFKPNLPGAKLTALAIAPTAAVSAAITPPAATKATPAVVTQAPKATTPTVLTQAPKAATPTVAPIATPPATKPPAAAAANNDSQIAQAAVLAWAQAWSRKDVASYLAAYGPQFVPQGGQNRSAWEKERRDRILGKASISVTLSDITVRVNGDKANAQFRQSYKAGALAVSSRKTLELQRTAGGWQITRESTGN
jgi:ketosteroid isomerase-like protein